jgi:hypothetical protein
VRTSPGTLGSLVVAALALGSSAASLSCQPAAEDRGWCLHPATADPGFSSIPPAGSALLHGGLTLDPSTVTCPAADFSDWPAFVRRHTAGYTSDPRFAGFDEDCVPRIDLEGRYTGVQVTQTPLVVANYGLLRYGDLLRGIRTEGIPDACSRPEEAVLAQARWLRDNADVRTTDGVVHWSFLYDFQNLQGDLSGPWSSGYAQGIAAPAFVAAYCVSEDEQWLRAAEMTMNDMVVRMPDGGVATWVADDKVWFEEAAAPEGRSARSLNGHLAAAAGLHAVVEWTSNPGVAQLRDFAFGAALGELDRYDTGFISLYTQWAVDHPLIAPALDYNRFHVQQLSWLYETAGDIRALDRAMRFARYDDPFWTWSDGTGDPTSVDFTRNIVYQPEWTVRRPGILEVDLGWQQTVEGIVLWSPDWSRRPQTVELELSTDGEQWSSTEHAWSDGCRDFATAVDPTPARYGRVSLAHDRDSPEIALQAVGLIRTQGHPTGVARWQEHGLTNRPAAAFTDAGWTWGRASTVTFDLDGTFSHIELVMTGFRGDALPVVTFADRLVGPFVAVGAAPVRDEMGLVWSLPAGGEYLRVVVDTPSNPGEDPRLFIRQGGP